MAPLRPRSIVAPSARLRRPRWPFLLGGVVAAAVVLMLFWDWNWFRPLAERKASAEFGRTITIGHFDIRDPFTATPLIVAAGIKVGNPPDFPQGSQFGAIDRVTARLDLPLWLRSWGTSVDLPEIVIDHPTGELAPGPAGNPNWVFVVRRRQDRPPAQIGALIINNGNFHINYKRLRADFGVLVHTTPPAPGNPGGVIATARGTYAGQPIVAELIGGGVLSLRDHTKPYPIDFRAQNGATRIRLVGTLQNPAKLSGGNLALDLSGSDLADLYPILGLPLASTPPYRLHGRLDYGAGAFRFESFTGTVGQSDLEGNISVAPGSARPLITADVSSRLLVMSDLAGFIGGAPGSAYARGESSAVKAAHAEASASSNLFPDIPLDLPKIRAADFDVRYRGTHIENKSIPLDNITAVITVRDGEILVHPLNFGVGTGVIAANIVLDARGSIVHLKSDIDFRRVDFHRLMQSTRIFKGAGVIGGRAEIEGEGNSLAQVLAHGNGSLKLFMTGGDISNLLVDLAGLDFGRTVLSLLGNPENTQIRCMVSNFGLQNGLVTTKDLVVDTAEADIIGQGTVNLRDETINYKLTQDPKHFSILALHAPIEIRGLLKKPSVGVEPLGLLERGGAAAALAVLLPGFGALIPTIQLGLGKDNDCSRLIRPAVAAAMAPHQVQ